MTEEEKDILILKILERPQSLTDDEVTLILSDQELLDIYNTSLKVKEAVRPALKVDPSKEWELMKARILSSNDAKEKAKTKAISITFDNEPGSESGIEKAATDSESEKVRKSFFASFLQGVSRKPVAAAVGTFVVAVSIAIGLLWKPEPIKQDGSSNGNDNIAQNVTHNNGTAVVNPIDEALENNDKSNGNNPVINTDAPVNIEALEGSQPQNGVNNSSSINTKVEEKVSSTTNSIKNNSNPFSTTVGSTIEPELTKSNDNTNNTDNTLNNQSVNPIEGNVTVVNDQAQANQNLAYQEESLKDFENSQLEGLLPDDWDIDQCLKLQQARIDNDLALTMAQNRKREYEIYRDNLLMEYQITNPDSDEVALEEIRAYLDEIFGNLYSAIP